MSQSRTIGLLLVLCAAVFGWQLIRQPPPPAAPPVTGTAQTLPPTGSPATTGAADTGAAEPPTTPTLLAATPQPPSSAPVQGDVPQDSGTSPRPTPGPGQRQVEVEEPPVDDLTDAQLQTALDRQTAGQSRLQSGLEQAAAAAAWQQIHPTLTAARTWSHIQRRAAVALLIGQDTDPAQPVPVKVITTWTGTDPEGVTAVHRATIKLLYHSTDSTWQLLS